MVWSPAPSGSARFGHNDLGPSAVLVGSPVAALKVFPENEATMLPVASETESGLLCGQGHEICAILWTKVMKLSSAAARDGDSQCSVGAEHRPGQADLRHLCSTA